MLSLKSNLVYIGLGSNLGDSRDNLARAIHLLEHYFKVPALSSSVYRSEPVDFLEQPWFLNQAVSLELTTAWQPTAALRILKEIESVMGREQTIRYGPRLIDLDLLLYGNWVLETADLVIPHPKIEERAFVLNPLVELNPSLISPRTGHHYATLIKAKGASLSACIRLDSNF